MRGIASTPSAGDIADLPSSPVDQVFVRAMVDLAKGLSKLTVAEFVEDEASLRLLRELGVDYAQGYYIGRPAPLPADAGKHPSPGHESPLEPLLG